jgi:hypothetical protein
VTPSAKREILAVLVQDHGLPVRRACQAVRLSRAAYYRPPRSRLLRDTDVVTALNNVAPGTRGGASGSASIGCAAPGMDGTTSECIACTAPCDSISRAAPSGGFRRGSVNHWSRRRA